MVAASVAAVAVAVVAVTVVTVAAVAVVAVTTVAVDVAAVSVVAVAVAVVAVIAVAVSFDVSAVTNANVVLRQGDGERGGECHQKHELLTINTTIVNQLEQDLLKLKRLY